MARQLDVTDALEARSRQIMWEEREIKLKGTVEDGGGDFRSPQEWRQGAGV